MNKIKILQNKMPFATCLTLLSLTLSCAHHPDVRPSADGIHKVLIRSETKEAGEKEALDQANDYCSDKKKEAMIVSESSQYTGSMKEEDYKTMKTAGKAAELLGGTAYVFGGKKESNAGGVVGLGGAIATQAAGNGYTVEMKFKCN
jgi:hypothetical protein